MKSRIVKISMMLYLSFCLPSIEVQAQVVSSNPLEYVALAEGNELINGEVKKQVEGQTKTALLQNAISAEFNQIHDWQKKYSNYLKSVNGYASSLKACTHLYNDGVRIFITLSKLRKAIGDNPQGIAASISMNNLYIETATELVSVYNLLKDAVAKGGSENMLTGAERSKTLWALNDKLSDFQKRLSKLHLSIRYNDGVRIFITLSKLRKAIGDNPQGIAASISMNNLYIETATELVSVYNLLKDAVAKGGSENMLTGAERSKTLWALNDKLSDFQKRLSKLHLSIRYYTMNDVWNNVTAGMIDRSNADVARAAMGRWRRAAYVAHD